MFRIKYTNCKLGKKPIVHSKQDKLIFDLGKKNMLKINIKDIIMLCYF